MTQEEERGRKEATQGEEMRFSGCVSEDRIPLQSDNRTSGGNKAT